MELSQQISSVILYFFSNYKRGSRKFAIESMLMNQEEHVTHPTGYGKS